MTARRPNVAARGRNCAGFRQFDDLKCDAMFGCGAGGSLADITLVNPGKFAGVIGNGLCLLIHRCPGRQIIRHPPPWRTRFHHVAQLVEHLAQVVLALLGVLTLQLQVRRNQPISTRPKLLGETPFVTKGASAACHLRYHPLSDGYWNVHGSGMIWKRLADACAWGFVVFVVVFQISRNGLTLWYDHAHETDGQVGLSVLAGSFYVATLSALIALGVVLMRRGQRK